MTEAADREKFETGAANAEVRSVDDWAWAAWQARAALSAPAVPLSDERAILADLVKWKELDDESTRWMPDSHSPTLSAIRDKRKRLEESWDRARSLLSRPSSDEALLASRLKDTPYGPAILLDDVRDAQRYRWLRDEANGDSDITPFYCGDALDAAIDAAIEASPKEPT